MKQSIRMQGIYSHDVESVWDQVCPMLELAMDYADGKYSCEKVFTFLTNKQMQLWVGYNDEGKIQGFAITEIVLYPDKKVLIIMFASGTDVDEWIGYLEDLQRFADDCDCKSVEIY